MRRPWKRSLAARSVRLRPRKSLLPGLPKCIRIIEYVISICSKCHTFRGTLVTLQRGERHWRGASVIRAAPSRLSEAGGMLFQLAARCAADPNDQRRTPSGLLGGILRCLPSRSSNGRQDSGSRRPSFKESNSRVVVEDFTSCLMGLLRTHRGTRRFGENEPRPPGRAEGRQHPTVEAPPSGGAPGQDYEQRPHK